MSRIPTIVVTVRFINKYSPKGSNPNDLATIPLIRNTPNKTTNPLKDTTKYCWLNERDDVLITIG